MMGRSHALAGGAAGLAVAHLVAPGDGAVAAVTWAVGSVAGLAPDLCHPNATIVRMTGPIGAVACRAVRTLSTACGLPAHRGITHTAVAAVALGLAVFAVLTGPAAELATAAAFAATAGALSALAGDWITLHSVRSLLWPFLRRTPGPPRWMRIRTGGGVETRAIVPALTVVTGLLAVTAITGWPDPATFTTAHR